MAVEKCFLMLIGAEAREDPLRSEGHGEWEVATGKTFGEADDIGLEAEP